MPVESGKACEFIFSSACSRWFAARLRRATAAGRRCAHARCESAPLRTVYAVRRVPATASAKASSLPIRTNRRRRDRPRWWSSSIRRAATPRCGFRSFHHRATRTGAPNGTLRTPAANPACRWNRRRRTPGESPLPSPPSIPHATGTTRRAWPTCERGRSDCSTPASAPR